MLEHYKIGTDMRLFFTGSGSIIWLGLYLTGFANVHWLLYLPAGFFLFAAVTGLCPGLIVLRLIMKKEAA